VGSVPLVRRISWTTGGLAEDEVAEQVSEWVTFAPFEVAVRTDAGGVADGEQDRGDGVGVAGRSASRMRCPATCTPRTFSTLLNAEGRPRRFQEADIGGAGERVHPALLGFFGVVFGLVAGLPLVAMMLRRPSWASESRTWTTPSG
jgi:hypothetical protein